MTTALAIIFAISVVVIIAGVFIVVRQDYERFRHDFDQFEKVRTMRRQEIECANLPDDGKWHTLSMGGHHYKSNWNQATEREKAAFELYSKMNDSGLFTDQDGHSIYYGKCTIVGGEGEK